MNERVMFIPFIGTELHKIALFKQIKMDVFKRQLGEVEKGEMYK